MERASASSVLTTVTVCVLLSVASSTTIDLACSPKPPAQLPERLAGRIVHCTPEQKYCLDRNKVLLEGKCYTLGSPGPCRDTEILVVDKKAYVESDVVFGTCLPLFTCNNNQFQERMSHDQCCYETDFIDQQICSKEMNMRLRKNVFGEGECELISNTTRDYTTPKYALKEGFCYFPNDLFDYTYSFLAYSQRFPQLFVRHALTNLTLHCSAQERECFEKERVLFPLDGQCYPLLTRGPCPQSRWLVLDAGALEVGSVTAVCAGPRCLPGQLFMSREQRCRGLAELQTELCPSEDLLFDVFGEAHCGRFLSQQALLRMPRPREGAADTCTLKDELGAGFIFAGGQSVLMPPCGANDQERCRLPVMSYPERPDA